MSEHKISLALAFLKAQPQSVARILEKHDIVEVADFMKDIPQSLATPVFRQMMPSVTARLCERLDKPLMVGVLSQFEINQVAAVLRCWKHSRRAEWLKDLPAKIQIGCAILLNYDQDMVGAWMTPHVVTIPDDCTVEDALQYVRRSFDVVYTNYVFILNSDGVLKGRVRFSDLIRANLELPISALIEKKHRAVSGRLPLLTVAENEVWEKDEVIPVKDRKNKFVGVLCHVDLRKGLARLKTKRDEGFKQPLGAAHAYGFTLLELLHSMKQLVVSDFGDLKGAQND